MQVTLAHKCQLLGTAETELFTDCMPFLPLKEQCQSIKEEEDFAQTEVRCVGVHPL